MENDTLDYFLTAIKLERKDLTEPVLGFLEHAKDLGYFDDPDLLIYNRDTASVLTRIAKGGAPHQVLADMSGAFIHETTIGLCLYFEWFTETGDPTVPLLVEGKPDGEKILSIWNSKHLGKFLPFSVFEAMNADFMDNHFNDGYRSYLFNLHNYAGIEEVSIERFFGRGFQQMRLVLAEFIKGAQPNDFSGFGKRFLDSYGKGNIYASQFQSIGDIDQLLGRDPELFFGFAVEFLDCLADLRRCTAGMAGISLELVSHNQDAKLIGDPAVGLNGFDILRDLVKNVLEDVTVVVNKAKRQNLQLFADGQTVAAAKSGGFLSIISRQQSFFSGLVDISSVVFTVEDGSELETVVAERNQLMDDLASLHRMCFLLSNRNLFAAEEQGLLVDKLATILTSASSNYYSDIFELYFAVLLKRSGVDLLLLASQRNKGNDVSTCDYKLGADVGADCKCLNTHNANLSNIAEHCKKVASQVISTIGYRGVEFGGAVIACRDQNFEFLKAFRDFKGVDKNDMLERTLLIQALMEIYAEFIKHGGPDQEKVKFIAFYYLPPLGIDVDEATGLKANSTTTRKEIFVVMTTKYASDEQLEQISKIFRPVCNFIFKFNNSL
ncbi:hypothetical protein J7E50_10110 [Pedobacter sp. ISL-68]|uniref:hypothetical protein n=1 Tax=unclassified Pedobacter TaxID=2628915 RepID=UPI001BE62B86|nr:MULTISPECIES: hypothetical protein [unclassified Pedobacter]MBT2561184.1 hypothetical protein [Pedobacter sp. ISL-64]MBT2590573.1 hypothetical protein [Pedobacter sp. ISL-68]